MRGNPSIVLIGGPNGAGKSTVARAVLAETLGITEFVNADVIAAGLSGFEPERAAFAAGRVMLTRLRELGTASPPVSFGFESTLASRTFEPWLRELIERGRRVHIIYLWLRSSTLAVRRVRARVRKGGHSVPEDTIRRRYARSAINFWRLYRPLAETWRVYDNSVAPLRLVAAGVGAGVPTILDRDVFASFLEIANAERST